MGFFSEVEISSRTPAGCGTSCTRYRSCTTAKVPLSGNGREGILIITETPLEDYELMRLAQTMESLGINTTEDCWTIPAVACSGDDVTPAEVQSCRPNVLAAITKHNPRLILMLGKTAMECVVGHSNSKIAFGKRKGFPLLCGKVFPDRAFPGTWLACAWSPSFICRKETKREYDPVVPVIWRNELEQILDVAKEPPLDRPDKVVLLLNATDTLGMLNKLAVGTKPFAFDYETTGLKPDAKGHRIVSIGFAPTVACGYAFALGTTPEWDPVKVAWKSIMGDKARPQIAHNLPYEFSWTHKCFNVVPRGWAGDTQVLAHLEDSRPGHSGLKVQSYLKFGVPTYDDCVSKFIRSSHADEDRYGCNALNNMAKAPVRDMLKYNALDALYTLRLWYWYKEQGVAANDGEDYTIHG